MKILILADPLSSHTIKWVNSLSQKSMQVFLFGLADLEPKEINQKVNLFIERIPSEVKSLKDGSFQKSIYLKTLPKIKSIIKTVKPDILHSHYASSYGLLGALTGFKPFLLSVWGNDVFDFPKKSFLHQLALQYVFRKANRIFSTSNVMAKEINLYTDKEIKVIPFGIDTEKFKPLSIKKIFDDETLVIGTVKSLSYKYGIEYLLEAFRLVKQKFPDRKIKLLIVGDGILRNKLEILSKELEIDGDVLFYGAVEHSRVPEIYNMIDIAVFPSVWESFGVSNLEAAACEVPQVASDMGGFKEIIENGITGFLVEPKNPQAIAEKIISLIEDVSLRRKIGKNAREKIIRDFDWNKNVEQMISEYQDILKVSK